MNHPSTFAAPPPQSRPCDPPPDQSRGHDGTRGTRHGVDLYLDFCRRALESARTCRDDPELKGRLLASAERNYTQLLEGIEDLKREAGELGRRIVDLRGPGNGSVPAVAEAVVADWSDPDNSEE